MTAIDATGTAAAAAGRRGRSPVVPPGHRRSVATLLTATLAINILALALPLTMLQVYNRILPADAATGTLAVLLSAVVVAVVLETVLRLARAFIVGRSAARYEHLMACTAMERFLGAEPEAVRRLGVGGFIGRMAAIGKLKDVHGGHVLTVCADVAFVPLFLLVIALVAGPLVLVPLAVILLFITLALQAGRDLGAALDKRQEADDRRFDFLVETLEGMPTVKALGVEQVLERRYEARSARSSARNAVVAERTAALFNLGTVFGHVMLGSVVCVGALLVVENVISAGALVAALLLSGRMLQPVQRALAVWVRHQEQRLAADLVADMVSMPQVVTAPAERLPEPGGRVCLSGVGAMRGGRRVLSGVDLSLEPGEAVALEGAHGAGKSALFDLVAGLAAPSEGTVKVDGVAVEAFPRERLVRHVGLLKADTLIFRGTIRDNITAFGTIDEKGARDVAAVLGLDADVAALPSGFDTPLSGTVADVLPPALAQRVAIARALAPKPRVILFDDADRGLDRAGYLAVYGLLARLKGTATLLISSEDANIRALADRTLTLSDGRLVETEAVGRSNVHAWTGGRP